jgi:hypothetical protein
VTKLPPISQPDPDDLTALLSGLASLPEPAPSDRLHAALRARILHRQRHRAGLVARGLQERLQVLWLRFEFLASRSRLVRALAAGLGVILVLMALAPFALRAARPILGPSPLPVAAGGAEPAEIPTVETAPEARAERLGWLASENDLRRLRNLYDERGKASLQHRLRKLGGADERTRASIETLASAVAADLLQPGEVTDVTELSLGLRALLGAGSTTLRGPHQAIVRRTLNRLESLLPRLHGADLAVALAGYLEGALVTGGDRLLTAESRLDILARHLRRFTAEQHAAIARAEPLVPRRGPLPSVFTSLPRPLVMRAEPSVTSMCEWSCPVGALGDAGLLLRVAPALGVPATAAASVRAAFARHLTERGAEPTAAAAAARAALLYSYGDLIDREAVRQSLLGYCLTPELFAGELRAVHCLAWGVFPGPGWSRFTQSLRYFVANYRDQSPSERACLLLVQLLFTAPNLDLAG